MTPAGSGLEGCTYPTPANSGRGGKKKKVDLIINITIIIIINNCKVEVDYFPVTARLQVFYSAYTTAIHQQLQLAKERQFLF